MSDDVTRAATSPRAAARLKVLSAGAVKYVVTDFAPKFTHETEHAAVAVTAEVI